MAYQNFTLEDVKQKLGLTVSEAEGIFAEVPPVAASAWLDSPRRRGAETTGSRKKLGPNAASAVATVWGFGYHHLRNILLEMKAGRRVPSEIRTRAQARTILRLLRATLGPSGVMG